MGKRKMEAKEATQMERKWKIFGNGKWAVQSRQMWRMKLLASGEEDPQKSRENKMKIEGPERMEGLVK